MNEAPWDETQFRREYRARAILAKVLADERFMDGMRESLAARTRGERPISLAELTTQLKARST